MPDRTPEQTERLVRLCREALAGPLGYWERRAAEDQLTYLLGKLAAEKRRGSDA